MKQGSLLSQFSNLSAISDVSYRGAKPDFSGSSFLKESFIGGNNVNLSSFKRTQQQEIGIDSLDFGDGKNLSNQKVSLGAFSLWTQDLNVNIEGTSDNQHEEEVLKQEKNQAIGIVSEKKRERKTRNSVQIKQQLIEQSSVESKVLKNQTKNIPKNFGKAIIIFIQKNQQMLSPIFDEYEVNYHDLVERLRKLKRKINTIVDLRNLWVESEIGKCMRVISNCFLRMHSLHYIYNSRIKTRVCHTKYKRRLQEALLSPCEFNFIKEY